MIAVLSNGGSIRSCNGPYRDMNWLGLIAIVLLVAAVLIFVVLWMRKGTTPVNPKQFYLDYNDVGQPLVTVFNGQLVKPAINPNDLAFMYTDSVQVSNGDVIQLTDTNTGVVLESRALTFNNATGVGDWSLLFNLRQQLYSQGYLNSLYTLSLVRNGTALISRVLGSNIVQIDWFRSDVRLQYPALLDAPLVVLGDLLFVAQVEPNGDRLLDYLYYCMDDRNNTFILHEASPLQDGPQVATLDELRQLYVRKFVGLTNYEVEEITYWEPVPPSPPSGGPVIVDTAAVYPPKIPEALPPPTDSNVLDLSSAEIANGDVVQIVRNGVPYYRVNAVNLDNVSNEQLSNDYKFLFSGLYSLIDSNFLRTGDFAIQVLREGSVSSSFIIPRNVSGVKAYADKRAPTSAISTSYIISDVAAITPRPTSGASKPTELWWCVDGNGSLFTNGRFTGVFKDISAYYAQQYPDVTNIVVNVCNYIDPTVFETIST